MGWNGSAAEGRAAGERKAVDCGEMRRPAGGTTRLAAGSLPRCLPTKPGLTAQRPSSNPRPLIVVPLPSSPSSPASSSPSFTTATDFLWRIALPFPLSRTKAHTTVTRSRTGRDSYNSKMLSPDHTTAKFPSHKTLVVEESTIQTRISSKSFH